MLLRFRQMADVQDAMIEDFPSLPYNRGHRCVVGH